MWRAEQLQRFSGARYQRLIALIEAYLADGVLVAGERLPAERVLAKQLQLNRTTVVRALDELAERGVIVRKIGSGSYINAEKWGVQAYPVIKWHLPALWSVPTSLYQQKVRQLRQQSAQQPVLDLASGDLPADLLPPLSLPNITQQELINQEQTEQATLFGLPTLKTQIINYMQQQFAMPVAEEEILITSGTQQSLFLITQGLLKPGDKIGIAAPSYLYALPLFQATGVRLYGIATDEQGITVEGLQQLLEQQRLKWIFIDPILQNPTGSVMSPQRKQAILQFCQKHYIGVVEDDAYSALGFDPQLDYTPLKKQDHLGQVLYLGSLSKYIGRNIRLGWMIGPAPVLRRLAEIRRYIDSGLSIVPQLLAQDYLQQHYQTHQLQLRQILSQRAQHLQQWLAEHYPQLQFIAPLGGFYLYAQLPEHEEQQQLAFLNQLLMQRIMVRRGQDFGDKRPTIRCSFAHFS